MIVERLPAKVFNNPHITISDRARSRWQDCAVVAELLGEKAEKSWEHNVEHVGSHDGTFFGKKGVRLHIDCDCELSFYFEYRRKLEVPTDAGKHWVCMMNGGIIFHQHCREWSMHT